MNTHSKSNTVSPLFPMNTEFRRPGRYVGCEWNVKPPVENPALRAVLIYPDVYEIGMSHFGLQVLYHVLSGVPDVQVDRAFAPWPDFEKVLRENKEPLKSLETHIPLGEFDILFITMPHEMAATNILTILDLAGIPFLSSERKQGMPLVIGGGVGSLNPMPFSNFFDAFLVGEGEEAIIEITETVKDNGGRNGLRKTVHKALAALEGCFVPTEHSGDFIHKRIFHDFENAPHPTSPLVPICRPIHERVVVEIARGCPRQCRFCQARVYYSPVRRREPETVRNLIMKNLDQTGYDDVSLMSLSTADYPGIESLVSNLMEELCPRYASISLPSLRPERLTESLVKEISSVRKSGFTLAPEAGSDRLRKIINKPYETLKLLEGVKAIFESGWNAVKLYFMIGQPFEEDSDIEAMADLVHQIRRIAFKARGKRSEVNVSVATFIPKPHTPFQWSGQIDDETWHRRIQFLRRSLRSPGIKFSYSDLFTSRLEAMIARGDERLSETIIRAYSLGCRFDAWHEWFQPDAWREACQETGVDIAAETNRNFDIKEKLPWDFIDTGVARKDLVKSYESARRQAELPVETSEEHIAIHVERFNQSRNVPKGAQAGHQQTITYTGIYQIRGLYRLFSHREIVAEMLRAARRAKIKLAYSQGFNPRPRFSFSEPAPMGFQRFFEVVEIQLLEEMDPGEVMEVLNRQLPESLHFSGLKRLDENGIRLKHLTSATYGFIAPSHMPEPRTGLHIVTQEELFKSFNSVSIQEQLKEFDFYMIIDHRGKGMPRMKDVIVEMYGRESIPFFPVLAARICWNRGTENHVPVLPLNQE